MPKLNMTVLAFSPDTTELLNLREALEPVIARYREATSYREACQKSQNENLELLILGYSQDQAPVDISDFYYFARENAQNKKAHIYFWGPRMDERLDTKKDSKVKFFPKGKFKDLIESLDEFSRSSSIDYVAQKTKEALPFFMTSAISEIKNGFERNLKLSLKSDELWKLDAPKKNSPKLGLIRARLLEGVYVAESYSEKIEPQVLQDLLQPIFDKVMQIAAQKVGIQEPVYKIIDIQESGLVKKELSEGSWKCVELHHAASSQTLAKVFLKIRPNPTPGIV
jgi:hypothetical protein